MKKMMIAMLAVAAMTSCSNENDGVQPDNGMPVEVKLSANVLNVQGRAAVSPGDAFGAQFVASGTSADYSSPLWNEEAAVAAGGAVTLTSPQYYPIDGTTVYMTGYAPKATAAAGAVEYVLTGQEDVMMTRQLSGSKATAAALAFQFEHKLTQLKFKVKAGNSFPAGINVTEIKVNGTKTTASLTLADGTLTFSGSVATVTAFTGKSYSVNASGTEASDVVMVEPGVTVSLDIKIDDVNSTVFTNIPVSLTTVAGSSHLITLTFENQEIQATATVAPWTPGDEGSGTVK